MKTQKLVTTIRKIVIIKDECAYYKASNRKFFNTGAVSASNKILDATASILVNKMMIKSSPKQNLSGCSGRCYF